MANPVVAVTYETFGTYRTPTVSIGMYGVTYKCRLSTSGPNTVDLHNEAGRVAHSNFMNGLETAFARHVLAQEEGKQYQVSHCEGQWLDCGKEDYDQHLPSMRRAFYVLSE